MPTPTPRSLAIVAALVVLSTSTLAVAGRRGGGGGGRLGKVGSGMRSGSGSRGSSGGSRSSGGNHGTSWGGHRGSRYRSGVHSSAPFFGALAAPSISAGVYAGAQKLVESDKAYSLDARILFDKKLGVAARFTQFREPAPEPMMSTLKLDLFSMAATYRLAVSPALEISPELGFAVTSFRGDGMQRLQEAGGVAGVSARYKLAPQLALVGAGRIYQLSGAASAVEGRAGVAVGPLQLSYRSVYFYDAGPPLEGPEVGLAFGF